MQLLVGRRPAPVVWLGTPGCCCGCFCSCWSMLPPGRCCGCCQGCCQGSRQKPRRAQPQPCCAPARHAARVPPAPAQARRSMLCFVQPTDLRIDCRQAVRPRQRGGRHLGDLLRSVPLRLRKPDSAAETSSCCEDADELPRAYGAPLLCCRQLRARRCTGTAALLPGLHRCG